MTMQYKLGQKQKTNSSCEKKMLVQAFFSSKMASAEPSSFYSYVWWAFLSFVSVLNILFFLVRNQMKKDQISTKSHSNRTSFFLDVLWNNRAWFTAIYVFVCAFRSFLPRHDGERACLWDLPYASVLLGRSAATIAEISYAALISLWIVRATKQGSIER